MRCCIICVNSIKIIEDQRKDVKRDFRAVAQLGTEFQVDAYVIVTIRLWSSQIDLGILVLDSCPLITIRVVCACISHNEVEGLAWVIGVGSGHANILVHDFLFAASSAMRNFRPTAWLAIDTAVTTEIVLQHALAFKVKGRVEFAIHQAV